MKYVFYNIRNLLKNEKFIFAVMLVCVLVSAWIMTFSYGLYQNFSIMRIEGDEDSKIIYINCAENETLTRGELKTYLDSLSDALLNDVNIIVCSSHMPLDLTLVTGDMAVTSRFTIHNGVYQTSHYIDENWNKTGMIARGRYFYDDEETNGSRYVIVDKIILDDPTKYELYAELFSNDNKIMSVHGLDFNVIGTHTSNGLVVPFLSLPEELQIDGYFALSFEHLITRSNYDELVKKASEILPGKLVFPELPFPDEESIYIYNNIMAISALIAALTVINFAFLYNFIFQKRRRRLAIMQICGCTPLRAWAICIGECLVICVPVFLTGMLTYIPFMHGVLSDVFEYMEESYTPAIYATIFIIYIIMLLAIMGIMLSRQVNKTLAERRKTEVG